MSRTKNSIRNFTFGIASGLLKVLVNFATRTVFINILGPKYLGISGLFYNILSVFSLLELGFGAAIVFGLYKPILTNDIVKIQAYMRAYRLIFRFVGLTFLILGLGLIPFLGFFIKDDLSFINVPLVYSIYLLQQVSSYLFFAYKSAIIQANQKSYLIQKINSIFLIIQGILQIFVLIAFKNFVLYAAVVVGVNLINNFTIGYQANKLFPYLKEHHDSRLTKQERTSLFKNSRALMYHRINKVVLAATDNLLLAKFIGLEIVGLYSNYLLIISTVKVFMSNLFNAVSASLGNLNADDVNSDQEKKLAVFNSINFMTFFIFGVLAILIYHTANEFISIWLGSEYVLDKTFLGLLSLEVYIFGILKMLTTMRDSFGLFQELKFVPLLSGALNLVLSFVLVQLLGINGLLLGTIISSLLTFFIIDPIVLFKKIFIHSPIIYFRKNLLYILIIFTNTWITTQLMSFIRFGPVLSLLFRLLISVIVPSSVIIILFSKTKEFGYLFKSVSSVIKKYVKS